MPEGAIEGAIERGSHRGGPVHCTISRGLRGPTEEVLYHRGSRMSHRGPIEGAAQSPIEGATQYQSHRGGSSV